MAYPDRASAYTHGHASHVQHVLEYVASQEGFALEELVFVDESPMLFRLIGRRLLLVTIMEIRSEAQAIFELVTDEEGQIVEDLETIQAAETAAYREGYGRLDPALHERLMDAPDDEVLPIAIWLAPDPRTRDRLEVYDEVADRYPEARDALDEWGIPWQVDDPDLADRIRDDYRQMRQEDTALRAADLVEYLETRGYEVTTLVPHRIQRPAFTDPHRSRAPKHIGD